MTDKNEGEVAVVTVEPNGRSTFFFDFINNKLSDIVEQMDSNDMSLVDELRSSRDVMRQNKEGIESATNRVISLIKNRIETRKADIENKAVAAKVKLLDKMEAVAMFGAGLKAFASYDPDMGVEDRIDQAQKAVSDKYSQKRESELGKVKDVGKEKGSIRGELKGIIKNIGGYLKADFKKSTSENKHLRKSLELQGKHFAMRLLGVTTAPVKMSAEAVKEWYNEGSRFANDTATILKNKAGHARDVTKEFARKVKSGAGMVWNGGVGLAKKAATSVKTGVENTVTAVKTGVEHAATAVKDGVETGAKKAKKKGLHARWVARDKAKKIKDSASTKWNGGKEAFGNFCGKIKEGAKEWGKTIKGSYNSAIITMQARREVRKSQRASFNAKVEELVAAKMAAQAAGR